MKNVGPKQCAQCGKTYKDTTNLTQHVKFVHEKLKTVICPECGRLFSKKDNLRRHIDHAHIKGCSFSEFGLFPFQLIQKPEIYQSRLRPKPKVFNILLWLRWLKVQGQIFVFQCSFVFYSLYYVHFFMFPCFDLHLFELHL